jgi:hypothetical protein
MESLRDTTAAAQWLTNKGVRRSPATLRKLRCLGGGPTYRLLNGRPYYTEPDLVAWIEERLSAPLRNSSDVAALASGRSNARCRRVIPWQDATAPAR